MYGLRTSSVLILDDKDGEALEIQKALALRGIGAVLVPGDIEESGDRTPLKGIRVAVLDIDLGFGNDSLARARHTAGVVRSLIDKENGPYVAIVWTLNPEDFELFAEELQKLDCPPAFTVPLEKAPVLELSAPKRAEPILRAVEAAIAQAPPIDFANLWEQIVRDAANETVVSLKLPGAEQAAGTEAMAFMTALLKSEADQGAYADDERGMRALLAALNPVHFDKVEERSSHMSLDELKVIAPIRESAGTSETELSLASRAELNASLLLDRRVTGFGPGRLYTFSKIEELEIGPALPREQEIRTQTVEPDHLDRAIGLPIVFLEVSAPCDHQQGNVDAARLIAGVAFPASRTGKGSQRATRVNPLSADYLRPVAPISLANLNGLSDDCVVLVWNARYPVSVSAQALSAVEPLGRLREPLLADIRAWLGYQASRPGYASA